MRGAVDVELMIRTIRTIRDEGCGLARRMPPAGNGDDWQAGARTPNSQAVSDLIGSLWLCAPDASGQRYIDAFSFFAMSCSLMPGCPFAPLVTQSGPFADRPLGMF
jgi:hypothetical protein